MNLIVPGGSGYGEHGGGRFVVLDPSMLGGGPQMMSRPEPEPEPEPTEWEKLRNRSDAVELRGEVEQKAAKEIDYLKKLDESGEGDLFPEKGKAGYVQREETVSGLGFNNLDTVKSDGLLTFDPESGEVQEFHHRSSGKDGDEQVSIVKEGGTTTYSIESGQWTRTATFGEDGSANYAKTLHLSDEMLEMMKLQMAMQMAGGGGGSPF